MSRSIATELAMLVDAYHRCCKRMSDNPAHWQAMAVEHSRRIDTIVRASGPSGSGIDSGTSLDIDQSSGECIVLTCSFHHMNEHGGYDGWTEHTIKVRASLIYGLQLQISGRDRNDIKEHLHEVYSHWLASEYVEQARMSAPES